jgi:hypothetical protein
MAKDIMSAKKTTKSSLESKIKKGLTPDKAKRQDA